MHIERAKWYKHIAFIYCIAKNIEKRKEKNLQAPGVDRGYFPMRTCPLPGVLSEHNMNETEKVNRR